MCGPDDLHEDPAWPLGGLLVNQAFGAVIGAAAPSPVLCLHLVMRGFPERL